MIPISQWLMARWARRLHSAQWAEVGCYPSVALISHHSSLAHALARDKPIREKGRFGYTGTPVTDADWLYGRAVLFVPVENVRIGYIRSAVDRRQSTDAAPVTESLVLYTFMIIVLQDIL